MLKPAPLHVGDHVAVVSLSSGTLENYAAASIESGAKTDAPLGSSQSWCRMLWKGDWFYSNALN